MEEISPAGLGNFEVLLSTGMDLGTGNFVSAAFALAVYVSLDVLVCLFDVSGYVEGITGGLGDGKTVC